MNNFNIKMNNNFMLINISPWPLMMMINLMNMIMSLIINMNFNLNIFIMMKLMMIIIISILWNLNSSVYKNLMGMNNKMMNMSMKMFMMMFIMSELMFFLTFFYIQFFNKMFNLNFNKNFYLNMFKLNFIMALMNLIILLYSSMTFMIFIKMNKMKLNMNKFLLVTILLSTYFIMIQLIEYKTMNFNSSNSIFFSNFYILTLFHMMHVIMGTLMMLITLINKMFMMNNQTINFTNTCWYWHFIDMIWIMIFFSIY